MKHIEMILKGDIVVLLDIEDFDRLKNFNWIPSYKPGSEKPRSVYRNIYHPELKKSGCVYLHQDAIGYPGKGFVIDHINGNPMDNRKINLRKCRQSENAKNRSVQKKNTSGFKGVFFQKELNKWRAQISIKNKPKHLGCFESKIDAAIAYNNAAVKEYGEFAKLNITEQCVESQQY